MKKMIWTVLFLGLAVLLIGPILSFAVDDIEKVWASQIVIHQTNAFDGGSGSTFKSASYVYPDVNEIDLGSNGYEAAQITVGFDADGSTDDFIVSVFATHTYTSGGGPAADYDTEEYQSVRITNDASLTQVTFIIRDLKAFRIGVKGTGSTDTFEYEVLCDTWNWEH